MKRTNRSRGAAALWVAGLIASGLGGDVLEARAGGGSVAREQVASPVSQAPASAAPTSSGHDRTAPSPTPPDPGRPADPPLPAPAAAPLVLAPAAPPTPAPSPTKKPTAPSEHGGEPAGKKQQPACTEKRKRRKKARHDDAARPTGKSDEATRGGLVNTRERARSATTGCQHAPATSRRKRKRKPRRDSAPATALRNTAGAPANGNPSTALAFPGAAPRGVPNFFIDSFRIPPFLLAIYQAAGIQYGIRWEVLAAINEIETDYGRNLNVSSAGALGWMQFMPATWRAYGVDANGDGRKDPFNPVDAIFAAARYLKAAGAGKDLRKAIFAYNHAGWYVDSVLARARLIGALPADLVGSLSGLTQGRLPVHGRARYAGDISAREARRRAKPGTNAARPVESDAGRRSIDIHAAAGSPAVAVQDATIIAVGRSRRLGRFVRMRDVYGNSYTYGQLGSVARKVAVPKRRTQRRASIARELELPRRDPKPTAPATAGRQLSERAARKARTPVPPHGGRRQPAERSYALSDGERLRDYVVDASGLDREDVVLKPLARGRQVVGGTVLGRIGRTRGRASSRLLFEIRPAGRGAPRIDPKPILDGWKLLESTALYRAQGTNAFFGPKAQTASIGQILLMSKQTLTQRVLANPRIDIYSCGQRDIKSGIVDRRVLASLEFLAASGLNPTVTSMRCGHGYYTSSGNVSAHSSGNAVDIAKINGIPILGNQGPGSITDIAVRRLLTLQGTMKPAQIITLMKYDGTDNTLALGDHDDHIHLGYRPTFDPSTKAGRMAEAVLKPSQWIHLIERLNQIDNPTVKVKPSKYAIRTPTRRTPDRRRGG